MYEQVSALAYQLRLMGIHNNLERRCSEAQASGLHPCELIKLLLEDEQLLRQNAAAQRLVTRGKFRTECELEDWDTTSPRGMTKAKLLELASLNFYHKKQNLIILGSTGVGKTHLAGAIGRRLCHAGIPTVFYPTNLLFVEAAAEKAAGRYLKFLQKFRKQQVLILDDFALKSYTHEEALLLLDLIEERYRKGSVIITSQVSPQGWKALFEDPVIAEAIIDRLQNPAEELALNGDSYRKKLAGFAPLS